MSPEWAIPRAVTEAQCFKNEKEIERLRGVLSAIAEAKGFDNIGAWARNFARTELVKSYGVLPTDRENGLMPNLEFRGATPIGGASPGTQG